MPVHANSFRTYTANYKHLDETKRKIYNRFRQSSPQGLSDREIRDLLFPDYDMNKVRPRITELKDDMWIEEIPSTYPRMCVAISPKDRQERICAKLADGAKQEDLGIDIPTYEDRLVKCIEALWPMAFAHAVRHGKKLGAPYGEVTTKHKAILDGAGDLLKKKGIKI